MTAGGQRCVQHGEEILHICLKASDGGCTRLSYWCETLSGRWESDKRDFAVGLKKKKINVTALTLKAQCVTVEWGMRCCKINAFVSLSVQHQALVVAFSIRVQHDIFTSLSSYLVPP